MTKHSVTDIITNELVHCLIHYLVVGLVSLLFKVVTF